MDLGLSGKVALVSGSWRGTGAGTAAVLAAEGAEVLVHGFEAGQADPVAARIAAAGGKVGVVWGDLTTDEGADQVAEQAGPGRVDVLVNNYGAADRGGWFTSSAQDWIGVYQKNVLSGMRLTQRFVPAMRERGWGRVIFVGTVGSVRPNARNPHYYASKAALPNMVVSLAKELAGSGVTANLVSPGLIATDEVKEWFLRVASERGWAGEFDAVAERVAAEVMPNPSGRPATVEEVGAFVAFVASDLAACVNGANLRIDGGAADSASL
ncbi:MAG: SDR family NAD(P)-dependent oxidoreductase [Acidimicrobiales bacterium]